MERVIGIFGSLLRQPSNLFSNLREQARRVAEINAVVTMWPEIESERGKLQGSLNLGQGYILLAPKDTKPYLLSPIERTALTTFYSNLSIPQHTHRRSVYRWGRLQIPTEQTAQSSWKEVDHTSNVARTDRNLKGCDLMSLFNFNSPMTSMQVLHQGTIRFVEAKFYFRAVVKGIKETLVMCSLFPSGRMP